MKKFIILLIMVFLATPVFASKRGALTNVYASWASVTTNKTFAFPYFNERTGERIKSRDLTIHNASAIDIVVDLKGNTIDDQTYLSGVNQLDNSTFQLKGDEIITFVDYVTDAVSVMSATGVAASPVSVIATY